MKNSDRLLAGIVVAIVALVVVAFVVAKRTPAPEYMVSEDSPEAAVHNYLLALRKDDHERAYGYLSPGLDGYPEGVEDFVEDMSRFRWRFPTEDSASAFTVDSVERTGDLALVTVEETWFNQGGLFNSGQVEEDFVMNVRPTDDGWKLTHGERYWTECWENPDAERCRPAEAEMGDEPGAEDVLPVRDSEEQVP